MKILALDIGGTAIKSAIANENGEISELQENATNAKNGGPYVMERAMEIAACYRTGGSQDRKHHLRQRERSQLHGNPCEAAL